MAADRDELIKYYFNSGYNYAEITKTLEEIHLKRISIRQLKRILKNLYRRKKTSDTRLVLQFIENQLKEGSGTLLGYGLMHQRCLQNGFCISRKMFH